MILCGQLSLRIRIKGRSLKKQEEMYLPAWCHLFNYNGQSYCTIVSYLITNNVFISTFDGEKYSHSHGNLF